MNQQDKQLLLTDLCGRLPYGVKFKYFDAYDHEKDRVGIVNEIDIKAGCFCDETGSRYKFGKTAVPIYFGLECLTQEITISGETFVPAIRIARLIDNQHNHDDSKVSNNSGHIRVYTGKSDDVYDAIIKITEYGLVYMSCVNDSVTSITVRKIDALLLQWHFDINGLIDRQLAVSVYSLDKNPYE